MNRTAIDKATVYCVDLAKNKFQVHGFSAAGERVVQTTLSRVKFDEFFAAAPQPAKRTRQPAPVCARAGTLVVMEACAGAHYWGRCFQGRGYRCKLVPAQFVAKLRHGNKTDGNDADAIYAVHCDTRVRVVPIKTVAQQDLCAQHRVRELLVTQRTQYINQARGLLTERGCIARRATGFAELVESVMSGEITDETTPSLIASIALIAEQIRGLNAQIATIERRLDTALAESPVAQRIDSIFGVGHITATAFAGEYGDNVARFADARQFAASIGVTPNEHSSGEQRRLGSITKRGNPYLRKLLVQCAQSILRVAARHDDATCRLAQRLLNRHKHRNAVVGALANHLARIIYAVIRHQSAYRPQWRIQTA